MSPPRPTARSHRPARPARPAQTFRVNKPGPNDAAATGPNPAHPGTSPAERHLPDRQPPGRPLPGPAPGALAASSAPAAARGAVPSLPLAQLLVSTADTVAAVTEGHSLQELLPRVPAAARPGTQALAFAVLRRLASASAALRLLAPRQPPPDVEALLQCALALLWPGDPPAYTEHTLVDQAVTATRQVAPASAGFVNAVLRRFLRERQALAAQVAGSPEAVWNHPSWWISALRRDWPGHWEALLAQAQTHPPMALRVNRRRRSRSDYLADLAEVGLSARLPDADPTLARLAAWLPDAVLLDAPCPVDRLPGFADGWVSVQDVSAQLAAPLLLGGVPGTGPDLRQTSTLPPGARVLDACAAPGGKTAHLLEWADLNLLALDSDATRLRRVDDTLSRLGLSARCAAADARQTRAWWDGELFDAILLDAPCSASGIVRRHPDIRWLRRPRDISSLANTQAGLLDSLWPLLKPGGRLLYATCSLFRTEGQAQVSAFLQRCPDGDARLDGDSPGHVLPVPDNPLQTALPPGSTAAGPLADGFYYALLHKPLA